MVVALRNGMKLVKKGKGVQEESKEKMPHDKAIEIFEKREHAKEETESLKSEQEKPW